MNSDEFLLIDSALTLSKLTKEQKDAVVTLLNFQVKETQQQVQTQLHKWAIRAYEYFQTHHDLEKNSDAYYELCKLCVRGGCG